MSDVWQRDEPESPCQGLCILHAEEKICIGCLRSGDEIAAWGSMNAEARRALLAELPARKARLTPRRRGGRARTQQNNS